MKLTIDDLPMVKASALRANGYIGPETTTTLIRFRDRGVEYQVGVAVPPHPPLRPVRQCRSSSQHRERPSFAWPHPNARPEADRETEDRDTEGPSPVRRCPCCGGRMIIVETFEGARPVRSPSLTRIRIDTS